MPQFQLNVPNEPTEPGSYSLVDPLNPPTCSGDQQICTIEAVDDGGVPLIDTNLLIEMVNALNRHSDETNVTLKA